MSKTIGAIFKDEARYLRSVVDGITISGCISNYAAYVEQNSNSDLLNPLERDFIRKLRDRSTRFVSEQVFKKRITNSVSREDLLIELSDIFHDGYYGISDFVSNDGLEYVMNENFRDADMHMAIREEMSNVLNDLIQEKERTAAEAETLRINREIKTREKSIEDSLKYVERMRREIEEYRK